MYRYNNSSNPSIAIIIEPPNNLSLTIPGKNSPDCKPGHLMDPRSPYPFWVSSFKEFKMSYNFVKCDDVLDDLSIPEQMSKAPMSIFLQKSL